VFKPRNLPKALIHSLIQRFPQEVLTKIEAKAQFFQGKGWGAATTDSEVSAIQDLLDKELASSLIVFDIGANIGNWTQSFVEAFPDCKIVAFEPGASAFKVLSSRFQSRSNIHCVNLGLSDRDAEVTLFSDSEASGLSSVNKRRLEHFSINFDKQEIIRVTRLDSWILSNPEYSTPTIIKLDVEGHELSVLAGAKETLKNIKLVQFEFGGGNIDSKTYFQDFWYLFIELKFDLYRLSPRGPVKVNEYSELLEVFRPTNYVAVRT
jgi:FkbM family methyltransferase